MTARNPGPNALAPCRCARRGRGVGTVVASAWGVCLLLLHPLSANPPRWETQVPGVRATAGILVEVETGTVLWERQADKRMYPASLTKVMTALLTLEHGDIDRAVTISERTANTGETGILVEAGNRFSVRSLLYACLVYSANDASVALAEATAGSVPRFVELMNKRAETLGATHTHFANPHGLHNDRHYATAADLSLIARQALAEPAFAQIVRTKRVVIPWPGKKWNHVLYNKNRLLSRWDQCDGVKTGYTKQAGNCLLASATCKGWQLLAVVLQSKDTWTDARTLLEAGFAKYERLVPVERGQRPGTEAAVRHGRSPCPLKIGRAVTCIVPKGRQLRSSSTVGELNAPVRSEQAAGTLTFRCGRQVVGQAPLVAGADVPLAFWWRVRPYLLRLLILTVVLAGVRLLYGTFAETDRFRWSRKPPWSGRTRRRRPGYGQRGSGDEARDAGGPRHRLD